jgi:hypothetical protein
METAGVQVPSVHVFKDKRTFGHGAYTRWPRQRIDWRPLDCRRTVAQALTSSCDRSSCSVRSERPCTLSLLSIRDWPAQLVVNPRLVGVLRSQLHC